MRLKTRLKAATLAFMDPARLRRKAGVGTHADLYAATTGWSVGPDRWTRIQTVAQEALEAAGLAGGRMLEIGGRRNPRNTDFPDFEYHALDLKGAPDANIKIMRGDITRCPQIEDESFDFIFSLDVFEHIDKPWLAGAEIQRLLAPGGVTMHSTLFAWRYHPCPIDYWRYSPAGLASLFPGLEQLHADFDMAERRRDIRGRDGNQLDVDAFGGWRENVRVNYAGRKPA